MKQINRLQAVIFILILTGVCASETFGQSFDVCQLYGNVYVTQDQREANFRVFLEDSEAFADLVVYLEENRLFADKPGLWFFTEAPAFANFSIYFVKSRGLSDFAIYYTDILSFAGCNK